MVATNYGWSWVLVGDCGKIMVGRGWSWMVVAKFWQVVGGGGWSWMVVIGCRWSHDLAVPNTEI